MRYIQNFSDYNIINEYVSPMYINSNIEVSENLKYHIDNNIPLGECVFRYGSESFIDLINEVKSLHNKNLIQLNNNDMSILNDIDISEGVVLGIIMEEDYDINEKTEYKGKKVKLNKPKRGGSKKFYVYVKDPKTNRIIKVSFGAKSGGGNLAVKLRDPAARRAFAARHDCEHKNDKTSAGYWSCRLPRYAKLLGLSGGGKWW